MKSFRSLKVNILAFLLIIFSFPVKANDDDKVKRGVERLNALIRQNEYNDTHGLSHKNKYIFSIDENVTDPIHVINRTATGFIKKDLSSINQELITLAIESKVHFYIAINGSQLVVGEKVSPGGAQAYEAPIRKKIFDILDGIYLGSNIGSLGEGKNLLLGITPVHRVNLVLKNPSEDKLYVYYFRHVKPGANFSRVVDIINTFYKTTDDGVNYKYSQDPYEALVAQKKLYVQILKNYDEEVKRLFPGQTPSALDFFATYKQEYYANPAIKKVVDEIGALIDEDEAGFKELMELMNNAVPLMGTPRGTIKFRFYNSDFTIGPNLGPRSDEYEAFKQSILTYRQHRQNIIELANDISCEPKAGETSDQFKARVYYCAALLKPTAAASLSLSTRENLLCALSRIDLSGFYTVARDQLTTDEGKEEVAVRILKNTPVEQRKEVLTFLSETSDLDNANYSVLMKLYGEIDFANFQDMMLELVDWLQVAYPAIESESWLEIIQRSERDRRAILPLGRSILDGYTTDLHYSNGTTISFKITENPNLIFHELNGIGVTEYVVVKFDGAYQIAGKRFEAGETYKMPALLAHLIMRNMEADAVNTTVKYSLYAAGLLIGATEIALAKTTFQATIALIDMGVASSDIAINEVLAEHLNQSQEGREFLDKWNKCVLLYAAGRVLYGLTQPEIDGWKQKFDEGADVVSGAQRYWRTASEMRDDVMAWANSYRGKLASTSQLEKFNKACAASYRKADGTVETVFGRNGGVLNTQAAHPTMSAEQGLGLHPELARRLPEKSMWPNPANCAECDAVNQALHKGAKWEDIQIHTIDIRPNGTMTDVIQCSDCQNIFKSMYVTSQ